MVGIRPPFCFVGFRMEWRRHEATMKTALPEAAFPPGISSDFVVDRPERLLLVQSIGNHVGEYLKILAEGWNESRRKDREFMALPCQEYAR